jgi:DNA-binding NtrC family response regulator
MPALRYRREDMGLLVEHFLSRLSPHAKAKGITSDALAILCARDFPGNLRELQHVIERLAWLADGPLITSADLVSEHRQSSVQKRALDLQPACGEEAPAVDRLPLYKVAKQNAMGLFERDYLRKLIGLTGNNLLRAAVLAGLQRHSLRELLRRHGLYEQSEILKKESNHFIVFDNDK